MYNDFFHFKEKPFALEPSARFIMLGKDHREALATLVYAIDEQEGYALLLGQPGVGKTTLIIALLKEMGDRVIPAVVTNPRVAALDFMNMMALELGLPGPYQSKGQFLVALTDLIKRSRREGKVVLLVIDEAHSLPPDMVEELRLLGNLDDSTPRVLNIFLVGQPELVKLLKSSNAVSLLQRLRRYHVLRPLSQEETKAYVRHRLGVAGGDPGIFDEQALEAVYRLSRGIPRLINSVCDDALLLAFTREQIKVDLALVMAGAKDDPTLRWTFGEPDSLGLNQGTGQPLAAAPLAAPGVPAAAYAAPATWAAPNPQAPATTPAPASQPVAPMQAPYQAAPRLAPGRPSRAERRAQAYAEKARRRAEKKMPTARKVQAAPPPAAAPAAAGAPRPQKKGSLWKKLVALLLAVALVWGFYLFYKHVGKKLAVRLGLLRPAILMPAEIPTALSHGPAKQQEQGPPDWGPLLRVKTGPAPAAGGNHG
ncbi:MAG: AAA family ATPase [Desulfarculus sp.]|nr:MAG: AAA family ATPase [Desulfarculus sp.]